MSARREYSRQELHALMLSATANLRHRGPDDCGTWVDESARIGLGHTRLSIIDLSSRAHQPMISASGRWVIVFNGEIYNFRALRSELEAAGLHFRSAGDAEVLLESIERFGIEPTLKRTVGMFAFGAYDQREHRLHLVRDRLGKKPLCWGLAGGDLIFASELSALWAHPRFDPSVSREALTLFLRYNSIPAPFTIYRNAFKIPPGCWLSISQEMLSGLAPEVFFERTVPYWSAYETAAAGVSARIDAGDSYLLDELELRLGQAVSDRLVADVPLGAFLSGGIDSSLVVALMTQRCSANPIRTFAVGFHEAGFDEASHARRTARFLGTEHHELYVTANQALDVISELPRIYDEPFADSSQIPTYLIARFARESVKVVLSGDGGDEVFGGYGRHVLAERLWRFFPHVPVSSRRVLAAGIRQLRPQTWNRLLSGIPRVGERIHYVAAALPAANLAALYRRFLSHWQDPETVVIDGREPALAFEELAPRSFTPAELMMVYDTIAYLAEDVLTKVDRASMAVGLEVRCPLLDQRVFEFAWKLRPHLKLRDGTQKWILRELLARFVPRSFFERPKHGFRIPMAIWQRGPLKGWAESLLDTQRIRREGFFRPDPVERVWRDHLSGFDHSRKLWSILMFQAWQDRVNPPPGIAPVRSDLRPGPRPELLR